MAFAKSGKQPPQEEAPRRTAVKIHVATDTRDAIVHRIANGIEEQDERGKQQRIGPSEIGNPCDFCLGAKLAGLSRERGFAWLPYLGTRVHGGLEKMFKPYSSQWLAEHRVTVGEVDGQEIRGTLDLFDIERAVSVDYKLVGDRTLDRVRFSGEISPEYRVQGHLYGGGLVREGWKVKHIAVFFLPRNVSISSPRELWSRGFWYAEDYNPELAQEALERATGIAERIRLVGADFVLPTLEKREGCFDCKKFEKSLNQLEEAA